MATPLKVLILEDNADDAVLIAHALRKAGYEPDWQRVDDEAGFMAALSPELDLILADYSLPQFDALRALTMLQTRGLDVPFVVVTGTLEEAAVEAMKRGADDYLLKDRLTRLGAAVQRALHDRELRREKREAEGRLRASELLHRVTLANISDVVLMTDDAGRFTYVSPSVEPIFGYTVREVQSLGHVWALLRADLYDPVTLARQGEITNIECEIVDREGNLRQFLITVKTVQIQGGTRLYTCRDITDRRRAEAAEQTHRVMVDALRDISALLTSTLDLDEVLDRILTNVRRVVPNRRASVMLIEDDLASVARSQGDYGDSSSNVLDALRVPIEAFPALRHMAETGEPLIAGELATGEGQAILPRMEQAHSYLGTAIRSDGRVIGFLNLESDEPGAFNARHAQWLQAFADHAAIAIRNARLYRALHDTNVVLEQAVEERTFELRQAKEHFEAILKNSPDATLILAPDGGIESGNPAFQRMFGYDIDEVYGQPPTMLVEPGYRAALESVLIGVLGDAETARLEVVARGRDAKTFDVGVALAPIEEKGELLGAVCGMRDISALKEVERMKDAFVSNVSHELRTPITSLKLNYELLLRNPTGRAVYMDRIAREIERLNTIIEDLLRLSRLDQDSVVLDMATIDLNALASDYVSDRTPLADSRGLTLRFDPTPDLPPVRADAGLMGQVLSVFLTNALAYTPSGGAVTVRSGVQETGGKRWVGISVADNGPGLTLDEKRRVFERFFRGQAAEASGAPGTGLGLSIAREIVERHRGRVEVASAPGEGATFTAWLPAAERPGAE
jgi:PAS domain S-box-containing protein